MSCQKVEEATHTYTLTYHSVMHLHGKSMSISNYLSSWINSILFLSYLNRILIVSLLRDKKKNTLIFSDFAIFRYIQDNELNFFLILYKTAN